MIVKDNKLVQVLKTDLVNGKINIPENVDIIDDNAFKNVHGYVQRIIVPEQIKNIGLEAFRSCEGVMEVVLPDGVSSIGKMAFAHCRDLRKVNIPKNLKTIPVGMFLNCYELKQIKLPNSIETIEAQAFDDCLDIKSITIPENVTKIEEKTFFNCAALKDLKLPDGVTEIGENAIAKTFDLRKIKLPSGLKTIGEKAFNLSGLKSLECPDGLESIGKYAFMQCLDLKTIKLNENLKSIDNYAFSNCKSLKSAVIPSSILKLPMGLFNECTSLDSVDASSASIIDDYVFANCTSLNNIKLSNDLFKIGSNAFFNCKDLEKIEIPDSVQEIQSYAFNECQELKNIKLPANLTNLKSSTFKSCCSLKNLTIPETVENIEDAVFYNCFNLENVNLPKNLKTLGETAFSNCQALKSITIPSSLKTIENGCFFNCSSLENLTIEDGVEVIKENAFKYCKSLKSLIVPNSVKEIEKGAFDGCGNLKKIYLPNSINCPKEIGDFKYFKKEKEGFSLSVEPEQDSIPLENLQVSPAVLSKGWKIKEQILREQKNHDIMQFYNKTFLYLKPEESEKFIEAHNFKFFKQFNFKDNYFDLSSILKFMYNLGVVSTPIEKNGKTIDYAQKISGFLQLQMEKGKLTYFNMNWLAENMKLDGLKPEFTELFMENFDELMSIERSNIGFLGRCYNEFELVQKTNTSNRGSQRQLKATVERFKEYFKENKFSNVNESNAHIAQRISPYFSKQVDFDRAVGIDNERQQNGIKNSILQKHLTGKDFAIIDSESEKIRAEQREILHNFVELASGEFSFDWLEKNDPDNFILGKLCSCCAHLEGVGYGIMRASIVHPSMQNLVIRDKNNRIIAKSTLYVNENMGYGVFNNVEVSKDVDNDRKNEIYKQYKLGIKAFAEEYNRENPKNPLKIITVGMNLNDLEEQLIENDKKSNIIYSAPDFGNYAQTEYVYHGDSGESQFVVWEKGE